MKERKETIASLVQHVNPAWKDIGDSFLWPPDLFHVAAYILKKSGAYRNVLEEVSKNPDHPYVTEESRTEIIKAWLEGIQASMTSNKQLALPKELIKLRNDLVQQCQAVTFNELRVLLTQEAKDLSNSLISAVAFSDHAAGGFGLPGKPGFKSIKKVLVFYVANLMLVTRGSLSTLPKFSGVVVPKMRTPQTGLTIRSLSLYLAFMESEVEIMWRSVPWVNLDQNSLNVLCVPWPKEIVNADFGSVPDTFESVRFFSYNKKKRDDGQGLESLIQMILKTNEERCRIHLVIFPELSFEYREYRSFLARLKNEYEDGKLKWMPMVIGGITFQKKDYNAMVMAIYFSGKWYMLLQTKHHRWKLTRSQLIQYELTGAFSVEREWFEKIRIEQRRLSFFSPNAWLTLCPLICEDLAQLEPVSEVIRSVGPSLLIALLMDGPQVKQRWPARYASVFADDPGTAVLSLTSLGMLKRSKPATDMTRNESTVGLWKDQLNGWAEIDVANGKAGSTALLSISASMKKEFSADGRNDNGYAPVFKLDNIFYPEEPKFEQKPKSSQLDDLWIGDWNDLRELTSVNFALDALITTCGDHWDFITYLVSPGKQKAPFKSRTYSFLLDLVVDSTQNPAHAGIDPFEEREEEYERSNGHSIVATPSLMWAVQEFIKWKPFLKHWYEVKSDVDFDDDTLGADFRIKYFTALLDKSVKDLEAKSVSIRKGFKKLSRAKQDEARIRRAVPLAVMISLHNRLDAHRFDYKRINHRYSKLFGDVEVQLEKYLPFG